MLQCYPFCFYYTSVVSIKTEGNSRGPVLEQARKCKSDAQQNSFPIMLEFQMQIAAWYCYNHCFQPCGSFAYLNLYECKLYSYKLHFLGILQLRQPTLQGKLIVIFFLLSLHELSWFAVFSFFLVLFSTTQRKWGH